MGVPLADAVFVSDEDPEKLGVALSDEVLAPDAVPDELSEPDAEADVVLEGDMVNDGVPDVLGVEVSVLDPLEVAVIDWDGVVL